jgi:hypothetical protein
MHDCRTTIFNNSLFYGTLISDIALDYQGSLPTNLLDAVWQQATAVAKIIKNDDGLTRGEQFNASVGSDISSTPCNQNHAMLLKKPTSQKLSRLPWDVLNIDVSPPIKLLIAKSVHVAGHLIGRDEGWSIRGLPLI